MPASKALSIHRLVQMTVFAGVPQTDKIFYLEVVIEKLSMRFPTPGMNVAINKGMAGKMANMQRGPSARRLPNAIDGEEQA